ncbi:MAG: hypothetical protein H6697_00420 [Myxococcales bacterium]|nr:hypothetical protein [Myxococcales bacterium]MCB9520027.1 hypothetical protein [Myxococcales bacterium]
MRRRRTRAEWARLLGLGAVRAGFTALLVLAFLSLGLRVYLQRSWEPEAGARRIPGAVSPIERLQTAQHLQLLESTVELYRLRHGRLPDRLGSLAEDGLIPPSALTFPGYAEPYFYARAADSYVLYPPKR